MFSDLVVSISHCLRRAVAYDRIDSSPTECGPDSLLLDALAKFDLDAQTARGLPIDVR